MAFLDNQTVRIFIVSITLVGFVGLLMLINFLLKKFKEYLKNQAKNIKD